MAANTQMAVGAAGLLTMLMLLSASLAQAEERMVVLHKQDISGHVFKRLGLPNQDYCWQQCLQEARCTGTRWGVIAGATAGQCQLFSGELTYGEPRELATGDGQQIVVTASRKENGASNSDEPQ
jgi:hypothetical protein